MNTNALSNVQEVLHASIGHIHVLENNDRTAVEQWVDRILDANEGCRKAHAFTGGTHKAPPLLTQIWDNGQYVAHPHEIAQVYLREWGSLWGQPDTEHNVVWATMREIIKQTRKHGTNLGPITEEAVKRGIDKFNKSTAVGMD